MAWVLEGRDVNEVARKVHFCKCDVLNWDDQVAMFKAAVANSPSKSCDVVIANAGVAGQDGLAKLDGKAH